ncbi:helix-turn-helix domain-containing protein [Brachybacterium sp. AOP35-5H-19]|uniref:helix-turn-helix domain-containing protein n=1 Tax=Brachybacterium sp. AOP35-5H-19 TaxID=3457685 RepID=UPI0040334917
MSAHPVPFTPFPIPDHLVLLDRLSAAERVRCHVATLDRWIAAGRLPVVRLGDRVLLRVSSLEALAEATATGTTPPGPSHALPAGARVTRAEAAQWLNVGETSLKTWANPDTAQGPHLRPERMGRRITYRTADITALIDAHSCPATSGPLAGRIA